MLPQIIESPYLVKPDSGLDISRLSITPVLVCFLISYSVLKHLRDDITITHRYNAGFELLLNELTT